jgi:hypothetical protein
LNYLPLQQGLVVLESTDIVFLFKVLVTIGMDQFDGIDGLSCQSTWLDVSFGSLSCSWVESNCKK